MSAIFCCLSISPYRPRHVGSSTTRLTLGDSSSLVSSAPYAIQLVRQINYGPQESIRYFVPASNGFAEATENDLLNSNFHKVNSYKNYRCERHNKFFEINLYQKNPTNTHHWRATLARPSRDIDLAYRGKEDGIKEKPSDQEENQEPPSSEIQGVASFPKPHSSLSKTVQEANEVARQAIQSANQPDMATLKRVLRFLLPTVGRSLGSSRLLSLLSLDWANAELGLGLEFEDIWKAELTSSNIIIFVCDCVIGDLPPHVTIDLAEVEDLPGKVRFHEIVYRVLESGRMLLYWVATYGDSITRVFTSGPSYELLERCQHGYDHLEQDRSNRNAEEGHEVQSEQDNEEIASWVRRDVCDDYDLDYDDYNNKNGYVPMKDFTACDQECGYVGIMIINARDGFLSLSALQTLLTNSKQNTEDKQYAGQTILILQTHHESLLSTFSVEFGIHSLLIIYNQSDPQSPPASRELIGPSSPRLP
ncbi:hypothetical protein BGZ57DRAFT_1011139 [Hyaloscypha finlandica]|nr:hypothetical protein BGZ57DRAFT_1011139 [Hyaloscypha finlandica]